MAGFLALVCIFLGTPAPAGSGHPTYLNSGELLNRALDALFDRIGSRPKLSMISVEPAIITVLTRSTQAENRTDEWTISRFSYLFFDRDSVSGPAPHQSEGTGAQAGNSFFDIDEIEIAALEEVVRRAKDYAELEDPPSVSSIRIAREVILLPERTYGAVQWRIGLASARESATVYADGAGNVTGADLSGTARAQRLDMLANDDWPAARVQAELAAVVGSGPLVHGVAVGVHSVSVTAELPDQANLLRTYSWDYSGVKRGETDMPNPKVPPDDAVNAPFTLAELDFARLPAIKQAAREAYGEATPGVVGVRAARQRAGTGDVRLVWRVDLVGPEGAAGHVDLSPRGEVIDVVRPPAQAVP